MGEHDPLGVPGGPRGVADHADVVGAPPCDLRLEELGVRPTELTTELLDLAVGFHRLVAVVRHAARIVVDDQAQRLES